MKVLVLFLLCAVKIKADEALVEKLNKVTALKITNFTKAFQPQLKTLKSGIVLIPIDSSMPDNPKIDFFQTHLFNTLKTIENVNPKLGNEVPRGHFEVHLNAKRATVFFFKNATAASATSSKYLVNNSTILNIGTAVNAGSTTAYFLDLPLIPQPLADNMKKVLRLNVVVTSQFMYKQVTDDVDLTKVYEPPSSIAEYYTYFVTSDDDWLKVPATSRGQLIETSAKKKSLMLSQVVIGTPYFVSKATPSFLLQSKGDSSESRIFRSFEGKNYIVKNGVTSEIIQTNIVIFHGVLHTLDWPLGIRGGPATCEIEAFSSPFYEGCKKVASCKKRLEPNADRFSVFVPIGNKTITQLATMNEAQKSEFFNLHFTEGYMTRYSLETMYKTRTHLVLTDRRLRINKLVDGSIFFVAVRSTSKDAKKGYVSQRLLNYAPAASNANVFAIRAPFGIYNYTVYDYLKSRMQYYKFAENFPYLVEGLKDKNAFYTVFAPTDLAFERWISTAKNGGIIYNNTASRTWVLRRHIIPNSNLILEDWKLDQKEKLYATANTPKDKYKAKIVIDDDKELEKKKATRIATKASVYIASYVKAEVDIFRGGIQASNGIVYPVDKVLSISTDVKTIVIPDLPKTTASQNKASWLVILLSLTFFVIPY